MAVQLQLVRDVMLARAWFRVVRRHLYGMYHAADATNRAGIDRMEGLRKAVGAMAREFSNAGVLQRLRAGVAP